MSFYIDDSQDYYRARVRGVVGQAPLGPKPTGEWCYCLRPNNPLECFFPSCGGRYKPEEEAASPTDWAKIYAKMDHAK